MHDSVAFAVVLFQGIILLLLLHITGKEGNMPTKQDVLDAIAAEKTAVAAKLDAQTASINDLSSQIQALKDQIAAGAPVTEQDLSDIIDAVHGIFVPDAEVPVAPTPAPDAGSAQ